MTKNDKLSLETLLWENVFLRKKLLTVCRVILDSNISLGRVGISVRFTNFHSNPVYAKPHFGSLFTVYYFIWTHIMGCDS